MPRGLATAMVFVGGFVVMGLVGWFVVWQVMDNIDNLSSSLQDGIAEGKKWLLNSPFHVTDDQINQVAEEPQRRDRLQHQGAHRRRARRASPSSSSC